MLKHQPVAAVATGPVRHGLSAPPSARRVTRRHTAPTAALRPAAASVPAFRPDVEGLRALAIGLVVLAHAGMPFAPGGYVGVDVFFVISGFWITRLLVGELERRHAVSLATFYARRIKRLMPQALLAVTAVVVASWLLLPQLRARAVAGDVRGI